MKFLLCVLVATCCVAGALALTECQAWREKELKSNSQVKLVPRCTEEGEYEAKQCFEGSPFCMCWRPDGTHITEPSLNVKSCACIAHRDRVQGRRLVGNYRPKCNEDGTYSRVQCDGDMRYCWCVDEHGAKTNVKISEC